MTESEPDRVVIKDNRKIDPVTGEARKKADAPVTESAEDDVPLSHEIGPEALLLEERTRDLQRVQAEYANYRKRMERDLQVAEQRGVARALSTLLPILDDWDRAREHGDVDGPIAAIVDKEQRALTMLGLEQVGFVGEPFDPTIHEAVMHDEGDDVAVPTATKILRKGYKHGERLLRPAMVGVTDPTQPGPAASGDSTTADESHDPTSSQEGDGVPADDNPATHEE